MAVIVSMHELDIAQKLADYVLCVKKDHMLAFGLPEEIFTEKLISDLYDLQTGHYNPVLGNIELCVKKEKAEVFVIAGGGTGIDTYRKLQREGIPFMTGILHENDIDCHVAWTMAAEIITEKSFAPIAEDTLAVAIEKMKSCKRVINCLTSYGEMNQKNEELLTIAKQLGKM